ncbi:hypothetical protein EDD15DRAFT_2360733 [Pisolithus albus]|nr:hypothetical protein EDD15DRAFT_2360733 [Pisolithus albus]
MPDYVVGKHIVDPLTLSEQIGGSADPEPSGSPPRPDSRDQPRSEHLAPTVGLPIHLRRPSRTTPSTAPPSPDYHSVHSKMSHANNHPYSDDINIYSDLESFTFGEARSSHSVSGHDDISPLTPVTSGLQSAQFLSPSLQNVSSHPSQGAGRQVSPPSTSFPQPVSPWTEKVKAVVRPATTADHELGPSTSCRGRVFPDDASQHTFGRGARHHGITSSSSSISVTSSRSSSRTSFQSGLLSSDDELEIGDLGGDSSPVTFARDYPLTDIDEDADLADLVPPCSYPVIEGRRGSLPMAIPGASQDGASRSRESSILTLRRPSRSLDDEYGSHIPTTDDSSAIAPKSEPLSRGDWRSLEAQIQAQSQAQSHAPQSSTSMSQHPADLYNNLGLDLQYIFHSKHSEGSIRSYRSSAQYSFLRPSTGTQPSEASSSKLTAIAPFAMGARRTSTATLQTVHSNEDPFFRHIRVHDKGFDIIEDQWLYQCRDVDFPKKRERQGRRASNASMPPPTAELKKYTKTMEVGQREHWWCPNIGLFKVDRSVLKPRSLDDSKAIHHRLNIRHVKDPHLKAGSAGPTTLVHKHSRATAFSIFRSFALNRTNAPQHRRVQTRDGVLLAPKKVQEHYTSTKTTRQLLTHGLLDDELRGARGNRKGTQSLSLRESHDKGKRRTYGPKAETSKGKGKNKANVKSNSSSGAVYNQETSPTGSQATTSSAGSELLVMGQPVSPIALVPLVDSVQTSETATGITRSDHRDRHSGEDSDEDRVPTRTPHAEAFGALDPTDIQHYMSRANRPNTDSGPSLGARVWRAIRGIPRAEGPSSSAGLYQPPWIVTAGRELQEDKDRLINNLNNSFRDVGLLHTQPHKPGSKSMSKRKHSPDVLDQVPDDCFYMLVPLWVGEVSHQDAEADGSETSTTRTAPSAAILPENRHYLLVWYVPWDDDPIRKDAEQQAQTKKSKHTSQTSSDSNQDAEPTPVCLTSFRVIARIVRYDDLRHSGVRAPGAGLAISGPAWEAMNDFDLMFASGSQDGRLTDAVICHCRGRQKGFLFDPEGLTRLGLCTKETLEATSDADDPMSNFSLTTIGKAAAEMIWLGCLAVTSFGAGHSTYRP